MMGQGTGRGRGGPAPAAARPLPAAEDRFAALLDEPRDRAGTRSLGGRSSGSGGKGYNSGKGSSTVNESAKGKEDEGGAAGTRIKDEIFSEIRRLIDGRPALLLADFDFRVRQHLHALYGAGGKERMCSALATIGEATKSKDRHAVKNWPAYILCLLKKFDQDVGSKEREARSEARVKSAKEKAAAEAKELPAPAELQLTSMKEADDPFNDPDPFGWNSSEESPQMRPSTVLPRHPPVAKMEQLPPASSSADAASDVVAPIPAEPLVPPSVPAQSIANPGEAPKQPLVDPSVPAQAPLLAPPQPVVPPPQHPPQYPPQRAPQHAPRIPARAPPPQHLPSQCPPQQQLTQSSSAVAMATTMAASGAVLPPPLSQAPLPSVAPLQPPPLDQPLQPPAMPCRPPPPNQPPLQPPAVAFQPPQPQQSPKKKGVMQQQPKQQRQAASLAAAFEALEADTALAGSRLTAPSVPPSLAAALEESQPGQSQPPQLPPFEQLPQQPLGVGSNNGPGWLPPPPTGPAPGGLNFPLEAWAAWLRLPPGGQSISAR